MTDKDWKEIWREFDGSDVYHDFQDYMVSKYGPGHYTNDDMYWEFQKRVIRRLVDEKLKERT